MGQYVYKAVGKDPTTGQDVEVEIRHSYLNDSGNMELSNEGLENAPADSKVNIVSKSDIQVKPGDDGTLQMDCEKNTVEGDPVEFSIKVCNGEYSKSNRVVAAKVNVAEVTFDNQKAHTTQVGNEDVFDTDKLRVNFRTDKWKTSDGGEETPTRRGGKGPVDVKLRGKSFDIRCHGTAPGGGIALQPSGTDTNGYENKIKFESSRISPITSLKPEYETEGGMGLEFGTFNNEHTSLFTKDYRFNKDGAVYAVTRGELEQQGDKIDYPTQDDDFKDILTDAPVASWDAIVKTAMVFDLLSQRDDPSPEALMEIFTAVFLGETPSDSGDGGDEPEPINPGV